MDDELMGNFDRSESEELSPEAKIIRDIERYCEVLIRLSGEEIDIDNFYDFPNIYKVRVLNEMGIYIGNKLYSSIEKSRDTIPDINENLFFLRNLFGPKPSRVINLAEQDVEVISINLSQNMLPFLSIESLNNKIMGADIINEDRWAITNVELIYYIYLSIRTYIYHGKISTNLIRQEDTIFRLHLKRMTEHSNHQKPILRRVMDTVFAPLELQKARHLLHRTELLELIRFSFRELRLQSQRHV